jgi:uncharacterized membrane protein
MKRFWMPVVAAMLGLPAVAAYAKDVNLTDHDRLELRQRADALKSENALGRTRDAGAENRLVSSRDVKHTNAKHTKKRHLKRTHARRNP